MPSLACPTCLDATVAPLGALPLVGSVLGAALLALAATLVSGRRAKRASRARRVQVQASRCARPAAPEDVDGLLRNGQAATRRGDHAEALTWFDLALRASPRLPIGLFCRGLTLLALERPEEARAALREAMRAAPQEAAYRRWVARARVALGHPHAAMDALEPVVAAEPAVQAQLRADPRLTGLRDHPRFLAMLGLL